MPKTRRFLEVGMPRVTMHRAYALLCCLTVPMLAVIGPGGSREALGQEPSLVPQIGSIMRKFGEKNHNLEWEKAAKLQDLWLSFPKHVASPVAPEKFDFSVVVWPAQTGITMDWILNKEVDSNGRAKAVYEDLLAAITNDPDNKMKTVIQDQVNRMFASTAANTVELGSLKWAPGVDVRAFHSQHAQYRTVKESLTDPIDPLIGALGTFSFHAIPLGRAQKLTDGSCRVDISDFVIYVIDKFDFQGDDQYLGYWKPPDSISRTILGGGTEMRNGSYNKYRDSVEAQGKGGDFILVTDTRTVHLPKTFSFTPEAIVNGTWTSSDSHHRFALAINGNSAEWTETGPETGIPYKTKLTVTQQGSMWRIERPNNSVEVLKMLGFQDPTLQQAILQHDPHPSFLMLQLQNGQLVAKWSGIRVKKTPNGAFKSLVQPEDPTNTPGDYALMRSS